MLPLVPPRRAEGTVLGSLPSAPTQDCDALSKGEDASCSYL